MSINWDLIDQFQKRFGAQKAFERARDFMFTYVSQIQAPLPPLANRAMEVARKFQEGHASIEERNNVQKAVWDYISERKAWRDTSPEYCIIRLMTLLVRDTGGPGESDSITEMLRVYLWMSDKFEDHSDSAASLLEQFFSSK